MRKMTELTLLVLLFASSSSVCSAASTYAGTGNWGVVGSWSNGTPTYTNTGLIGATDGTLIMPGFSYGLEVKLTGGTIGRVTGADINYHMRGGADGTTDLTIIEIDVAGNSAFTDTNFDIEGQLVMWAQYNNN